MAEQVTGGCACGRIRYPARIEDEDAYLCHCRMCQRSHRLLDRLQGLEPAHLRWEHEPHWYDSLQIAQRPYWRECRTSLGFRFRDGSDRIDLTVASFDEPSRFRPTHHFGAGSMHRAWLDTKGLPGKRTQDRAPAVDRWIEAKGYFPA